MPNSNGHPWIWVLIAFAIFLILLAAGYTATAVVVLLLGIALVCLYANLNTANPSSVVWWIFGISFAIAIILGIIFVPAEWSTPKTKVTATQILATLFLLV